MGHIVSEDDVEADPEKIDKIAHWPTPSNPEEVRRFLGFAGYYRKFVKYFSKIARPLSELMPANTKPTNKKKTTKEWNWSSEHQEAFDPLKQHLTTPPILHRCKCKRSSCCFIPRTR